MITAMNPNRELVVNALGEATLGCWAQLSQDVQRTIFERAVECGHQDSLREQLAEFLHDTHPRTEKHD